MKESIYKKQGPLMNQNELNLYKQLRDCVGQKYLVVPQVHLEKLIKPARWIGNIKYAIGHVSRKSVDFALFDLETFEPVLAIELNGYSHEKIERYLRDVDVKEHLKEANLPLLTLSNGEVVDKDSLNRKIDLALNVNH